MTLQDHVTKNGDVDTWLGAYLTFNEEDSNWDERNGPFDS